LNVVERNLDDDPVPHLRSGTLTAIGGTFAATEAAQAARELSDTLIREVRDADLLVIGAPMYNFGISSTLKSWFDHVLRAGETFRYEPTGPEGMVPDKPVVVIETRGGTYSGGPNAGLDSQEPHLRTMLGFIGLTDIEFVQVENSLQPLPKKRLPPPSRACPDCV
jgi:FMN-dependent NADH-azoreductase